MRPLLPRKIVLKHRQPQDIQNKQRNSPVRGRQRHRKLLFNE